MACYVLLWIIKTNVTRDFDYSCWNGRLGGFSATVLPQYYIITNNAGSFTTNSR